jgi:hypothetical protein
MVGNLTALFMAVFCIIYSINSTAKIRIRALVITQDVQTTSYMDRSRTGACVGFGVCIRSVYEVECGLQAHIAYAGLVNSIPISSMMHHGLDVVD